MKRLLSTFTPYLAGFGGFTLLKRPIVFDEPTLNTYKSLLSTNPPSIRWKFKKVTKEAAVLVPLCSVDGKASVLFTVRSSDLRVHKGEVSFPGGKKDPEDESLVATALRETFEEILIPPQKVQVLGALCSLPNKTGDTKVTAFIAHLGEIQESEIKFNRNEVAQVFTIPIKDLAIPTHLEHFRNTGIDIPSWKLGTHRIWGLTGYFLSEFLKRIVNKA